MALFQNSKSRSSDSPEVRAADVVNANQLERRKKRLAANGKTKLYHRTHKEACGNMLKEKVMRPGRVGRLGPAIYGTSAAWSTRFKTGVLGSCCMVVFSASLGRVLTVPADTPYVKIGTVLKLGYDSAHMPGLGYAIYFSDQINGLAAYPCDQVSGNKNGPYVGVSGDASGLNLGADAPVDKELKPKTDDPPVVTNDTDSIRAAEEDENEDDDEPPLLQIPNVIETTLLSQPAAPVRDAPPRANSPPTPPDRPEHFQSHQNSVERETRATQAPRSEAIGRGGGPTTRGRPDLPSKEPPRYAPRGGASAQNNPRISGNSRPITGNKGGRPTKPGTTNNKPYGDHARPRQQAGRSRPGRPRASALMQSRISWGAKVEESVE